MQSTLMLWLLCLFLVSTTTGYPHQPAMPYSVTSGQRLNRTRSFANKTRFAGVNICGFDFGCDFNGTCNPKAVDPPLIGIPPTYSTNLGNDGPAQMSRFVYADNLNMFRLPVSWQYLTNNTLGGQLNPIHFGYYDRLVQSCLDTGAYCQVDLHNYARWQGKVIGEPDGPTNEQFADIWAQIADQYASDHRVWFGIMNEPHDMASAEGWAASVQAAVTAIRRAGATRHFISLPATGWQSAGALPFDGSGEALMKVTNLDNSTSGLIFDVHLYLNAGGTGQTKDCVTDGIMEAWRPLTKWLRKEGRQAIVTEAGGGATASCLQYVCQELNYLRSNSDVFSGYLLWAAGSFSESYILSLTPIAGYNTWVDTALMMECIARK